MQACISSMKRDFVIGTGSVILLILSVISLLPSIGLADNTTVTLNNIYVGGALVTNTSGTDSNNVWLIEYDGQSAAERLSGPLLNLSASCTVNGTPLNYNLTFYKADASNLVVQQLYGMSGSTGYQLPNSWDAGNYRVEASCSGKTDSKYFYAHKLSLFFQSTNSESGDVGSNSRISVIFKKDGQKLTDASSFRVVVKDSTHIYMNKTPDYIGSDGSGDYVYLSYAIPYDVPTGSRTIEVEGIYGGNQIAIGKSITVGNPIDVKIATSSISCKANEYCAFDLDVIVNSTGPTPLSEYTPTNFVIGIYSSDTSSAFDIPVISRVDCNENTKHCILKTMTGEKLPPGSYALKITAVDNQLGSSPAVVSLISSFFLQGSIRNAQNNPVAAKMTLASEDNSQVLSGDFSGDYKLEILKGLYDMSINFENGALIADIYNASFEDALLDSTRNINYDSFEKAEILEGVHTVKVVVLELGFDFQSANLRIPYDSMNVYNEENLQVYRCTNWNFGMRKCNGNWTSIGDSKTNAVADFVEVQTGNLSAFLLGERKFLHFNTLGTADKETGLGGTIPIEGQVLDSDGNNVRDVTITLKVGNFTTQVASVDDGSFVGYVTLPYREGLFDVAVSADKEPYESVESKVVVKTVKKEDLSVVLPDSQVPVTLDKPATIEIGVSNPGQVNITNIQFSINGLSVNNYQLVPAVVNSLGPGETKQVKLNVNMTSADCGDKCLQYTSVGVSVSGKSDSGIELSNGGTFIIEIQKPTNSTLSFSSSGGGTSAISGLFSAISLPDVSTENIIGIFLLISIIVVVILIMKKRGGEGRSGKLNYGLRSPYGVRKIDGARGNVVSSMNELKSNLHEKK